jgi:hypothetical protein
MTLGEYLKREKIGSKIFADRLGTSAEAVRLYAAGRRIPRPDIMAKIGRLTDGAVQPNDFFAASKQAPRRRRAA